MVTMVFTLMIHYLRGPQLHVRRSGTSPCVPPVPKPLGWLHLNAWDWRYGALGLRYIIRGPSPKHIYVIGLSPLLEVMILVVLELICRTGFQQGWNICILYFIQLGSIINEVSTTCSPAPKVVQHDAGVMVSIDSTKELPGVPLSPCKRTEGDMIRSILRTITIKMLTQR